MPNIIYAPRAQEEVNQVIDWYEERQSGLGKRFVAELQTKIAAIKKQPDRYAIKNENYREVKIDHFSYLIIYTINDLNNTVTIASVFHVKRNPEKKYKAYYLSKAG